MTDKIHVPADSEAGLLVADLIELRAEYLEPDNSWHRTDYLCHQAGKKAMRLTEMFELVVEP